MRHVTIELSEAQEAMLCARLANSEYASLDAFVAALIEEEWKVDAQERLEALLLEGLEGEEVEWTPVLLHEIRREAGLIS